VEIITYSGGFVQTNDEIILIGIDVIDKILDIIVLQAMRGVNVFEKYEIFTQKIYPIIFCSGNLHYPNSSENLTYYQLSIYFFIQMKFLINSNAENWEMDTKTSEIMNSYITMPQRIGYIMNELIYVDKETFLSPRKSLLIIIIVIFCFILINKASIFNYLFCFFYETFFLNFKLVFRI
jgi:hypothetical protein